MNKNEIKVEANWEYADNPSPQFTRLMSMLLSERRTNDGKKTERVDGDGQPGHK